MFLRQIIKSILFSLYSISSSVSPYHCASSKNSLREFIFSPVAPISLISATGRWGRKQYFPHQQHYHWRQQSEVTTTSDLPLLSITFALFPQTARRNGAWYSNFPFISISNSLLSSSNNKSYSFPSISLTTVVFQITL